MVVLPNDFFNVWQNGIIIKYQRKNVFVGFRLLLKSSNLPAYRRTKKLKEVQAPTKFQPSSSASQTVEEGGCFNCNKNKRDLYKNFLH